MPNLPLIAGSLGYTCYPASAQTFLNDAMAVSVALQTASLTGVLMQDATPTADQTGLVWIRTLGGAPVFPPVWIHFGGQWLARHPIPFNDQRIFLFEGTSAAVGDLDRVGDGTGTVALTNAGPFWEIVSAYATRMPIGVGTLPSGTVLAVGDTGGEEKHTLSLAELPTHTHRLPSEITEVRTGAINDQMVGKAVGSARTYPFSNGVVSDDGATAGLAGSSHNNLPLYKAVYFIRRTIRVYCTSPIA